jgi:NAD(P)-dependent dehydrogenase (short-subunit alcohol dehydrogenase family)
MTATSNGRVAVVTGGNRGLGLETCRQLASPGFRVVLTARDETAAQRAAERLGVDWLQLDVTDDESRARAASVLRDRYGHIGVLVNNAGIALEGFDAEVARATIDVNLLGAMAVTDALLPLLSDHASIVMVSSGLGKLSCVSSDRRRQFEDMDLSRDRLVELTREFVQDVADGTYEARGWPGSAYRVSKVALNAFTRLLARDMQHTQVLVNAVCPGWVRTDMGGPSADRDVEEGARSIVWAATLAPGSPSGGFFLDGAPVSW